ncbi:MAG: hypothetical protein J5794_02675, partial [Lachnospiraceae bacterium]|nr:hypothetical protein [Lachnospiraceae bacterium]
VSSEDLTAAFQIYRPKSPLVLTREDELLSELKFPAFTHYLAVVNADKLRFQVAEYAGHLGKDYGLEFYEEVVRSEAGQAMLRPITAQRSRMEETIRQRIDAASSSVLFEIPFVETGDPASLKLLECRLKIREESSVVFTDLLVKNTGGQDLTACLALPTLLNSIRKDTLKVTDASAGVPIYGGKLYVTIPEGEALAVSYSYQTSVSLTNAGAIGMDFKKLLFDPNGRVGHFSAEVELTPISVPLVTEVSPVNFVFDGKSVFLELWDFAPNTLLNRFYIAKETLRNYSGSRDYELNETEQFVLKNLRRWYREGISPDATVNSLLDSAGNYFVGRDWLWQSPALFDAMEHLILTTKLEAGILSREAIWERLSSAGNDRLSLLTRDLLHGVYYGEAPAVAIVQYTPEESLSGVQLYGPKTYEYTDENGIFQEKILELPITEMGILRDDTSSDPGFSFPLSSANLHVASIRFLGQYSEEELRDYLDVIGASLFVKSMLLDNRDGKWGAYCEQKPGTENGFYYRSGYASVPAGAVYTAEDLKEVCKSFPGAGSFTVFEREDPLLESLRIPALTQYYGAVRGDTESGALLEPFVFDSILGIGCYPILEQTEVLFRQEHAKALLTAKALRLEERKALVLKEISSARGR